MWDVRSGCLESSYKTNLYSVMPQRSNTATHAALPPPRLPVAPPRVSPSRAASCRAVYLVMNHDLRTESAAALQRLLKELTAGLSF